MKLEFENLTVPKVVLETGEEEVLYKLGNYWYLVGVLGGFEENVYKPLMPGTSLTKLLDELLEQNTN